MNKSVATAGASSGMAGAAVVIVTWALGLARVQVPPEVAAACMVIIAPPLHLLALRLGMEPADQDAPPPPPPPPLPAAAPAEAPKP